MFRGIDADKFKFADDGNLLISASSTTELHQRTEVGLLKFFNGSQVEFENECGQNDTSSN